MYSFHLEQAIIKQIHRALQAATIFQLLLHHEFVCQKVWHLIYNLKNNSK